MSAHASRSAPRGEIVVHEDAQAAARAGAEAFAAAASDAAARSGRFSAALSGGSTPRGMYSLLAEEGLAARVPWERVHLFWSDERCVPPGHPRSNFRMASEALLSRVPIPAENVHRMRGELPPASAAREYEAELRDWFGGGLPRFDLVHLGLGADGHTASLFPLDEERLRERERWVAVALERGRGEARLTLTPPVLEAAARVEVLVLGAEKAEVARATIEGALDPFRLPAQLVRPRRGVLTWRLSAAAASRLESRRERGE